jgi:hypothetical protein
MLLITVIRQRLPDAIIIFCNVPLYPFLHFNNRIRYAFIAVIPSFCINR